MFTGGSRSNSVAELNQLMYCMTIPGRKHKTTFHYHGHTFGQKRKHENNNLGKENTVWSEIGVKLTSINTNSSTTCNKTSEFDILYNDGYM
jgi:hypothetical protein